MALLTLAYITNFNGDSVSVINTATNTVIVTIPVSAGSFPTGVAVNNPGAKVYISTIDGVYVIDASTNVVETFIIIAAGQYFPALALNPAGTRLYISDTNNNQIYVIDTLTNTIIDLIPIPPGGLSPTGLVVNPAGTRLYVNTYTVGLTGELSTFDITADVNTHIGNVSVGNLLFGIEVNTTGTRLYITDQIGSTLWVFDATTPIPTLITNIIVGNNPIGVAINSTNTRVYVANAGDNTVSVIDATTNLVIATVTVGTQPFGIDVTPDDAFIFVANADATGNTVSVIDAITNLVVDTVIVGLTPQAFGKFMVTVFVCNVITIGPLPNANLNVPYSHQVVASPASTYTFAITSGSLPPGLTLSPSGLLSGTPTLAGGYTFTITATDTSVEFLGCQGSQGYDFLVIPPKKPKKKKKCFCTKIRVIYGGSNERGIYGLVIA